MIGFYSALWSSDVPTSGIRYAGLLTKPYWRHQLFWVNKKKICIHCLHLRWVRVDRWWPHTRYSRAYERWSTFISHVNIYHLFMWPNSQYFMWIRQASWGLLSAIINHNHPCHCWLRNYWSIYRWLGWAFLGLSRHQLVNFSFTMRFVEHWNELHDPIVLSP